jgi:hypothetical protein
MRRNSRPRRGLNGPLRSGVDDSGLSRLSKEARLRDPSFKTGDKRCWKLGRGRGRMRWIFKDDLGNKDLNFKDRTTLESQRHMDYASFIKSTKIQKIQEMPTLLSY